LRRHSLLQRRLLHESLRLSLRLLLKLANVALWRLPRRSLPMRLLIYVAIVALLPLRLLKRLLLEVCESLLWRRLLLLRLRFCESLLLPIWLLIALLSLCTLLLEVCESLLCRWLRLRL
jgi:hypothetical protein